MKPKYIRIDFEEIIYRILKGFVMLFVGILILLVSFKGTLLLLNNIRLFFITILIILIISLISYLVGGLIKW